MKAKKLLLLFLLSTSMTGFAVTKTVTATADVMSFSPMNLVINFGDIVNFQLASIHDAAEVGQDTYNVNGSSLLPGGFTIPFGGGVLSNLSVGTHWYICQAHIIDGMKGTITVTALGVNDFQLAKNFIVFPNPATNFINIKVEDGSFDFPYMIIDAAGRQVSIGKLSDVNTLVDLTQLTSGIYFLQVGEDKRQNFKVIKK